MRYRYYTILFVFIFSIVLEAKNVELIIDASGSMRGKLPNGELKINAAKQAVGNLLKNLPENIAIACRAYGHQFPREEHNCLDTELLTNFGSDRTNAADKIAALQARGYTPITFVLLLAVKDFPENDSTKTIILVSDGKETCDGDPCALADSLVKSGTNLVIHTVGFGVLEATRSQLECISRVTGGSYFGAENSDELFTVLTDAVDRAQIKTTKKEGFGKLEIKGADLSGHVVTNAFSGEEAGRISRVNSTINLAAGIYNVTVGKAVWKSVQVETDKTTVLEPGWLTVNNPTTSGHDILENETGVKHGWISNSKKSIALMPGQYDVMFKELFWPVQIRAGVETTLDPGTVTVKHASYRGHKIRSKSGALAANISNTSSWAPLVPGEYTIEINEKTIPFVIKKGEDLEFSLEN